MCCVNLADFQVKSPWKELQKVPDKWSDIKAVSLYVFMNAKLHQFQELKIITSAFHVLKQPVNSI